MDRRARSSTGTTTRSSAAGAHGTGATARATSVTCSSRRVCVGPSSGRSPTALDGATVRRGCSSRRPTAPLWTAHPRGTAARPVAHLRAGHGAPHPPCAQQLLAPITRARGGHRHPCCPSGRGPRYAAASLPARCRGAPASAALVVVEESTHASCAPPRRSGGTLAPSCSRRCGARAAHTASTALEAIKGSTFPPRARCPRRDPLAGALARTMRRFFPGRPLDLQNHPVRRIPSAPPPGGLQSAPPTRTERIPAPRPAPPLAHRQARRGASAVCRPSPRLARRPPRH